MLGLAAGQRSTNRAIRPPRWNDVNPAARATSPRCARARQVALNRAAAPGTSPRLLACQPTSSMAAVVSGFFRDLHIHASSYR